MDSSYLPAPWLQMFFKHKPLIPAVIQLVAAVAIIIVGCFGEIHMGTPWWSGILFLVSGTSLCMLCMWQLVKLETFCFITVILSILASVAAIVIYSVEFSNPQNFPHYKNDLVLTYQVDVSILGLCSSELGISAWILLILILSRRMIT